MELLGIDLTHYVHYVPAFVPQEGLGNPHQIVTELDIGDVLAGFGLSVDAVEFGAFALPQTLKLREYEPDPMAFLVPVFDLAQSETVVQRLSFFETFKTHGLSQRRHRTDLS